MALTFFFAYSADAQTQLAVAVEKERSATEELLSFKSQLASLESQNSLLRQEKARLLAQLEAERNKKEKLEDDCSRYHFTFDRNRRKVESKHTFFFL